MISVFTVEVHYEIDGEATVRESCDAISTAIMDGIPGAILTPDDRFAVVIQSISIDDDAPE